jgi:hypothetical protein
MSLRGARDGAVPRVFILDDLSEAQAAAAAEQPYMSASMGKADMAVALRMSALGQKQACALQKGMSALGQKQTFVCLLDQFVGACEQWQGYREAERLGGLEVDCLLVLGRRLNRHVSRLFTFKDSVDVAPASVLVSRLTP